MCYRYVASVLCSYCRFCAGELRVCHVSDVRMLLPTKSSNPVTLAVGHLICSNFRLKFIPLVDKLKVVKEEVLILSCYQYCVGHSFSNK